LTNKKIKIGDIVTINWSDETSMRNALVLHIPQDIGDWWRVEYDNSIMTLNPMCPTLESISKEETDGE